MAFPCRAAVGAVVLKHITDPTATEVLLIHRGKEPAMDRLCFPGGRLSYGESLAACAVRETKEETGIDLRCDKIPEKVYTDTGAWECPWPLTVVDGLFKDAEGHLQYHYVIVEVLRTLAVVSYRVLVCAASTQLVIPLRAKRCSQDQSSSGGLQMLATVKDTSQEPVAADDATSAAWHLVSTVRAQECESGVHSVLKLAMKEVERRAQREKDAA